MSLVLQTNVSQTWSVETFILISWSISGSWWVIPANGSIRFTVVYKRRHWLHHNQHRSHVVRVSRWYSTHAQMLWCVFFFLIDISRATDSDLEMDEPSPPPSSSKRCSFVPVTPPPTPNPVKTEPQKKIKNKLLVQTSVDEQRLRQLQDRANGRLSDVVHTQPLPRKTLDVIGIGDLPNGSVAQIGIGSNENPTKSVPMSKRTLASRVMKNDFFNKRVNIPDSDRFLLDLPPDWLSQKNKLNRKRLKIQRYYHSASRKSSELDFRIFNRLNFFIRWFWSRFTIESSW